MGAWKDGAILQRSLFTPQISQDVRLYSKCLLLPKIRKTRNFTYPIECEQEQADTSSYERHQAARACMSTSSGSRIELEKKTLHRYSIRDANHTYLKAICPPSRPLSGSPNHLNTFSGRSGYASVIISFGSISRTSEYRSITSRQS